MAVDDSEATECARLLESMQQQAAEGVVADAGVETSEGAEILSGP